MAEAGEGTGCAGTRRLPISAFVIACNEAARLPATLAALQWADQIVVVDSGSTDDTCDIARRMGAEVHFHAWEGYGPQKVYAESLCRNDWLLNVDADEVVTPVLAAEIATLFATGAPSPGAWRVRILNVYPGDVAPRPLAADYEVVRLYHRDAGRYRAHPLFDRVEIEKGVTPGRLAAPVHHFPLISWAHLVDKENRYSSYSAETAKPRSRSGLILRLPFEFPLVFLKFYLLRRHITGGWKGLAFSIVAAFGRTLRVIKMLARTEAAGEK
ncbi:glycosyltransferase family 2 protein [Limibaculum sp. M0105]|uniref:Glycosyltransferase family 2 protein n=1 Tax=Thermohalobaculum xanthum TaxID=2753746 RepID=A0A8J7M796_9RHOB|nr:glycosyltransferase family 2 protein [Thermohalobaculum xanthum]MBK0399859.1 glycosyltransferase family 2 protein [Thermohalobaculum xanthum]